MRQGNYEWQKNAAAMFLSHLHSSSSQWESHGCFSFTFGTDFVSWDFHGTFDDFVLTNKDKCVWPPQKSNLVAWLYSIPSTADIYIGCQKIHYFIAFQITTTHIWCYRYLSTNEKKIHSLSLCWIHRITFGADTQAVPFPIFGLFSNWHGASFVFATAMSGGGITSCHLPVGFGMGNTAEKQKAWLSTYLPSLSPPIFSAWKDPSPLRGGGEVEERSGQRHGALRHTVDCGLGPPRPNPRPPSSRPHPPPSWSGAHTDRWNVTSVETLSPRQVTWRHMSKLNT